MWDLFVSCVTAFTIRIPVRDGVVLDVRRHPLPPHARPPRAAYPTNRRRSRRIRRSASSCRATTRARTSARCFARARRDRLSGLRGDRASTTARATTPATILDELAGKYERLRVVHLATNRGKALALNAGAIAARHEIIVGDRRRRPARPHAVTWLVRRFLTDGTLGGAHRQPADPEPLVAAGPAPGRRVLRHRRFDQARTDALRLRVHRLRRRLRVPQAGPARRRAGGRRRRSPTTWT